jgi:hypothetical protein
MFFHAANRRAFIKQAGLTLFLPYLESIPTARGQSPKPDLKFVAIFHAIGVPNYPTLSELSTIPKSVAPSGFFKDLVFNKRPELFRAWNPKQVGANWELSELLKNLAPVKQDVSVISGTYAKKDNGGNIHTEWATPVFLCGKGPKMVNGAVTGTLRDDVTKTLDFMIAEKGPPYPVPVLVTGLGNLADQTASLKGGPTQYFVSWPSNSKYAPKHVDPVQVFKQLFTGGLPLDSRQEMVFQRLLASRISVIDLLKDQRVRLASPQRSAGDLHRLDEFWQALSEIEKETLARQSGANGSKGCGQDLATGLASPEPSFRDPPTYVARILAHYKLIAMALKCGLTRVATHVLLDGKTGGTTYPYHYQSHYGDISRFTTEERCLAMLDSYKKYIHDFVKSYAFLVNELKNIPDVDGSRMLDNSMVLMGSTLRDPDSHTTDDLPILLAGRGRGTLSPGSHYRFEGKPPYSNLLLTIAQKAGLEIDSIGYSNGTLKI